VPASAPAAPAVVAAPGTVEAMLQDRVMGQDNAPVTIVEYASFTCPHCATFHGTTLAELKKEYIDTGRVKLIFRDFPFDEAALRASMMARCMPPERYFPMVDTLFKTQNNWARDKDNTAALSRMAKLAGMSEADFAACMSNEALLNGIVKMRLDGEKQYGVQSTPSFIIDGKHKLSGVQPLAEFEKIVKPLLPKP
jgi:protein-disulfide isomerase